MGLKNYLQLDGAQQQRLEEICRKYRRMYEQPEDCEPMFLINTPSDLPSWEERLADPLVMLQAELDVLRSHLEIGDDRVPTVRVQFGTAQVAAAFGCGLFIPPNNLPAAKNHVLKDAQDVYGMPLPSLDAGWYGKLERYTQVFLENLPQGVFVQHPDIQSTFNTAHLIRGNDILLDFYDDPDALCALLDLVTDYMILLVPYLNKMIGNQGGWFYDYGALWKGAARISNCSAHMISPELYKTYVLPRDVRLMKAIGGGRVHYCGSSGRVIDAFFQNPEITGLDYDLQYHDLWELSRKAPRRVTLLQWGDALSGRQNIDSFLERLFQEGWPQKRNIILQLEAPSVEEGKALLNKLRQSVR